MLKLVLSVVTVSRDPPLATERGPLTVLERELLSRPVREVFVELERDVLPVTEGDPLVILEGALLSVPEREAVDGFRRDPRRFGRSVLAELATDTLSELELELFPEAERGALPAYEGGAVPPEFNGLRVLDEGVLLVTERFPLIVLERVPSSDPGRRPFPGFKRGTALPERDGLLTPETEPSPVADRDELPREFDALPERALPLFDAMDYYCSLLFGSNPRIVVL